MPRVPKNDPTQASPVPLIPLPIIVVRFERIGMDLICPLPKSSKIHEHILVIVDHATRYGKSVPQRKTTSRNVGLTDQGVPFMSKLMADVCQLLQIKQLRTSVYYSQTDLSD